MMKKLDRLTTKITALALMLATPLTAMAHPGHGLDQHIHGFLHTEHLLLLLAVVAVIAISHILKK